MSDRTIRLILSIYGVSLLIAAALGLPLLLAWSAGWDNRARVVPAEPVTYQSVVKTVAVLSEEHGTLGVTGRDYTTVDAIPDANVAIWEVPAGANYAEFRFEIDQDANTADVQIWAARQAYNSAAGVAAVERFTLAWEFALTGGTQTGYNSNVFVDTLDVNEFWSVPGVKSDAAGGNRISRFDVDLRGVKYLAFLRTDSEGGVVYIDVSHY